MSREELMEACRRVESFGSGHAEYCVSLEMDCADERISASLARDIAAVARALRAGLEACRVNGREQWAVVVAVERAMLDAAGEASE